MSDSTPLPLVPCSSGKCANPAMHTFCWPGQKPRGICKMHEGHLLEVARGLGADLELVPVDVGRGPAAVELLDEVGERLNMERSTKVIDAVEYLLGLTRHERRLVRTWIDRDLGDNRKV